LWLQRNAASAIAATAKGRFVRDPVIQVSDFAALRMNGRFSCGIAASCGQAVTADFESADAFNVAKRHHRPLVPK